MKLKVLVEFRDKNDHKTMYKVGQIIEVADHKRAANLVSRDLCDFVEETVENQEKKNSGKKSDGKKSDKKADKADGADANAETAPAGDAGTENGDGQNSDQE